MLVAFEGQDASGYGQLNDVWEAIGPDDVLTPAEVYANLTSEGFAVKYFRVPVTDGTSPSVGDPWVVGYGSARVGEGEGPRGGHAGPDASERVGRRRIPNAGDPWVGGALCYLLPASSHSTVAFLLLPRTVPFTSAHVCLAGLICLLSLRL